MDDLVGVEAPTEMELADHPVFTLVGLLAARHEPVRLAARLVLAPRHEAGLVAAEQAEALTADELVGPDLCAVAQDQLVVARHGDRVARVEQHLEHGHLCAGLARAPHGANHRPVTVPGVHGDVVAGSGEFVDTDDTASVSDSDEGVASDARVAAADAVGLAEVREGRVEEPGFAVHDGHLGDVVEHGAGVQMHRVGRIVERLEERFVDLDGDVRRPVMHVVGLAGDEREHRRVRPVEHRHARTSSRSTCYDRCRGCVVDVHAVPPVELTAQRPGQHADDLGERAHERLRARRGATHRLQRGTLAAHPGHDHSDALRAVQRCGVDDLTDPIAPTLTGIVDVDDHVVVGDRRDTGGEVLLHRRVVRVELVAEELDVQPGGDRGKHTDQIVRVVRADPAAFHEAQEQPHEVLRQMRAPRSNEAVRCEDAVSERERAGGQNLEAVDLLDPIGGLHRLDFPADRLGPGAGDPQLPCFTMGGDQEEVAGEGVRVEGDAEQVGGLRSVAETALNVDRRVGDAQHRCDVTNELEIGALRRVHDHGAVTVNASVCGDVAGEPAEQV